MALSRRLARPMLASIFVVGGWDAFRNPAGKAKKAVAVTEPLAETVGTGMLDTETLVRVNGAVQVGAGVLLAVGKFRRLAALALIGSIIPTTYAGHRFWEETDPTTRAQQKMHFLKNVGLLGGLILAAFDTEGEPSLAWRAKRQAKQLESAVASGRAAGHRRARRTRKRVTPVVSQAAESGRRTARRGRIVTLRAGRHLGTTGHAVLEQVRPDFEEEVAHAHDVVADALKSPGETALHAVQQVASFVSDATRQLEPLAGSAAQTTTDVIAPLLASGAERTTDVLSKVRERLPSD